MKLHEKLPVGTMLNHAEVWMDGYDATSTQTQFAKSPGNDMWPY